MIDLEELKKLPNEEKWRIIDELEASMEAETKIPEDSDDLMRGH